MANNGGNGFILTTKLYKNPNGASFLYPNKRNPEGKADVNLEGMAVHNKEKTTTKQQAMRKMNANKIHMKLVHSG